MLTTCTEIVFFALPFGIAGTVVVGVFVTVAVAVVVVFVVTVGAIVAVLAIDCDTFTCIN